MTETMKRTALNSRKKAESFDVVRARFNRISDTLSLTLRNGMQLRFPRVAIRELAKLKPQSIGKVEIQPGGDGISFRDAAVDIYVPGLLLDELGTLLGKGTEQHRRGTGKKKAARKKRIVSRVTPERTAFAA